MKPPYRLVPDTISTDTVHALRALLADAEGGRLIGIAFAAMYRHRYYIVNTAGESHRNPTFSLGMLRVLAAKLSQEILRG